MAQSNFLQALHGAFAKVIPHCAETGIRLVEVASEHVLLELPYRDDWLADRERRLLHPGIVSTLVDSACGVAVLARIGRYDQIATIDLRLDYLRPAFGGASVWCRAECFRLTDAIAFARSTVWQADAEEPVAVSQGVFMRGSQSRAPRGPLT